MASSSSNIDMSGPSFCVIIGASKDIGRFIAVEVSKRMGPKSVILLLARDTNELAITASLCKASAHVSRISSNIQYVSIDLSTASEKEMYDVIVSALKGYQVQDFSKCFLFHNVASLGKVPVNVHLMENVQEFRDYYDINVFRVISLNTQFLKIFEEIEDRVIIVNISSQCAFSPISGLAYYCSGIAARQMYFRVLAEEKKDIKILNFSPGPVDTALIDNLAKEKYCEIFRHFFTSFCDEGVLMISKMAAEKCVAVVLSGKFSSGDHVDIFDE